MAALAATSLLRAPSGEHVLKNGLQPFSSVPNRPILLSPEQCKYTLPYISLSSFAYTVVSRWQCLSRARSSLLIIVAFVNEEDFFIHLLPYSKSCRSLFEYHSIFSSYPTPECTDAQTG